MTDTVKVQNLMLKVAVVIFALLVCILESLPIVD
jgi:hypothetical protein